MTKIDGMIRRKCHLAWAICGASCLAIGAMAPRLLAADPSMPADQLRPKVVGKLELKLKPSHAAIRSDAPFSIDIDLESTFSDLLEGDLELTFVDDTEVRLRLQTGPIAVPNGKKSFGIVLPAMAARQERANFVVRAVFRGSREQLDLGTHDLVVPMKGQRQFLMAAAGLGDDTVNHLARHLALDTFRPSETGRATLLTLPVELDPHAISADPVGLYPFDVLVFAGEYFSRLSPRQLDTIAEWIETGGGAVFVPSGVLTPAHLQFLERLAGRDTQTPSLILDQFGRLPPKKSGSKDWLTGYRYGYGRALILQTMPRFGRDVSLMESDGPAWTRAVCFLWNVRSDQTSAILKDGSWRVPTPAKPAEPIDLLPQRRGAVSRRSVYRGGYSEYDDRAPLHPDTFAQADALRAILFPEEVSVVPFRVVATILTLFLLAIAPADYLILGLLRRRRYTWLVFPTLCVLFTVATVWVAGYYTGTVDHRGSVVIVDVGTKGKPLRTTRIDHIITAGTRPITTDVKNGLFARTDVQPLRSDDTATKPTGNLAPAGELGGADANDGLRYAGALPSAFTVTRLSRQWTPTMDRVTASGTQLGVPQIVWPELDSIDTSSERGRAAIIERVRRVAPDCELVFLTDSKRLAVQSQVLADGHRSRFRNWPAVLAALAQRSDNRLFSIVSQISPNGAGDLEDLSVLSGADPNSCLLHVAIERGEDLFVFRRLLRPNRRLDLN
jgi:hypothetical protein